MSADRPLDPAARAELVSLLTERGRLLRPGDALLDRAMARLPARPGTPSPPMPDAAISLTSAATLPSAPPGSVAGSAATIVEDGVASSASGPALVPRGRQRQLAKGLVLAGYRIEDLLGRGGMGEVYRATQLSMNRSVAFKVLPARLAHDRELRERFQREARSAGRLHHPNLISVHDVGEADGVLFFSMELVEGSSLKQVLKTEPRLPEGRALSICRQVLEALRYAHAQGVVHRDIKPDNIMLTGNGVAKIADLGLSRLAGGGGDAEDSFATQAGVMMGTPHYMPPEQGRDARQADQRSDLYSLGATLYHLVCGAPPFEGATPMAVVLAASTQELRFPQPPPSLAMQALLRRLMARDPADRPADAAEAIALLDGVQRGLVPAAPRRRRTWRRVDQAVGLLAVAVIVVAAILAFRWGLDGSARRAWERRDLAAGRLAETDQYGPALDLIHSARIDADGRPDLLAEIDQRQSELEKAWDAWARRTVRKTLGDIDDAIRQGRWQDARAGIRNIPEAQRSPSVAKDLARFDEAIDQGLEKALQDAERSKSASVEKDRAAVEARLRERLLELPRFFMQGFAAVPPDAMSSQNGWVRMAGSGQAASQRAMELLANGRFDFWLNVRCAGSAQLLFKSEGGPQLMASADGLSLVQAGRAQQVARADAGNAIHLALRRVGENIVFRIDGPGQDWRVIGPAGPSLRLGWECPRDSFIELRAEPRLTKRDPPRPPGMAPPPPPGPGNGPPH